MSYQKYLSCNQEIQNKLLVFLDREDNIEENYQSLIDSFTNHKIFESHHELKSVLYLISNVHNNHYRLHCFNSKIEKILKYLSDEIKKKFSNITIFNIFKSNKAILLILFEKKILYIDQFVINIMKSKKYLKRKYIQFFSPEISEFIKNKKEEKDCSRNNNINHDENEYENSFNIDDLEYDDQYDNYENENDLVINDPKYENQSDSYDYMDGLSQDEDEDEFNEYYPIYDYEFTAQIDQQKIPDNFFEKRKIGENDEYICKLIRDDLIDEFITFINKNDYPLNSKIKNSIYETNHLLIIRNPTLIKYAAFFGSIQIFKYLYLHNVDLTPSIWIYAIHSDNPELIHFLEENGIQPINMIYKEWFKEAIKCHHNDIANYIQDNYFKQEDRCINCQDDFKENNLSCIFHYYNFSFFPKELNDRLLFFYACKYDNYTIVEDFLKTKKIDSNEKLIQILRIVMIFDQELIIFIIIIINLSAIQYACKKDNFEIIWLLLREKNEIKPKFFNRCEKITQINIPSSINIIGRYAFAKCMALMQVFIPSSVVNIKEYAFYKCSSLEQIQLSSRVVAIDDYVFSDCVSLKQINIPSSVLLIGKGVFQDCSSLEQITLPLSVVNIGEEAFKKCTSLKQVTILSNVKNISKSLFYECSSLTQITIPSFVKSIENFAFFKCSSLKQIIIPSSVETIGSFAFQDCSSLTQITFEAISSLIKIGYCAFKGCSSITQLEIPFSVNSIGEGAFVQCFSLNRIIIHTHYGIDYFEDKSLTFKTEVINDDYDTIIWVKHNVSTITIPPFVKTIGAFAFYNCSSLKQITIPSSVTSIEKYAFNGCSYLNQITFQAPSHINIIEKGTFSKCSFLKQISIPSSVTTIDSYSFQYCSSLTQITIPSSVTFIGYDAFYKCSSLKQISLPLSLKRYNKCDFGIISEFKIKYY